MDNEETINLDNVTMHRSADGTVEISSKKGGGCVTIGLFIPTAIVVLAGIVMTLSGVIELFKPEGAFDSSVTIFGFFVVAMFGGFAYYLYLKIRNVQKMEPITITPFLNVIEIGDRSIPFNDIMDISAEEIPSTILEGAVVEIFLLILSDGKTVELGQVTLDRSKADQRKTEITTFLKVALKKG